MRFERSDDEKKKKKKNRERARERKDQETKAFRRREREISRRVDDMIGARARPSLVEAIPRNIGMSHLRCAPIFARVSCIVSRYLPRVKVQFGS